MNRDFAGTLALLIFAAATVAAKAQPVIEGNSITGTRDARYCRDHPDRARGISSHRNRLQHARAERLPASFSLSRSSAPRPRHRLTAIRCRCLPRSVPASRGASPALRSLQQAPPEPDRQRREGNAGGHGRQDRLGRVRRRPGLEAKRPQDHARVAERNAGGHSGDLHEFGDPRDILFGLVLEDGHWRIDEIQDTLKPALDHVEDPVGCARRHPRRAA